MKKVFCFFAAVLVAAGAPCTALAARRESTTYAFVGNTEIYTTYVDRTKGNITTVCPDYFEIDSAGNLKLTNKVSHTFVENMRARGVRVTPFLSNHWDMANARAGLNNRATLAGQLAAAVRNYRFDGVDVDIENINQNDRAAFTDFIRLLRAELGPDKTISVCVAANPWGVEIGWQGAYDYRALSPYIDHIFIMAYDEHYSGGSAGPVASYGFARKSVEFALKTLPPEKVMLGIPFYGRYWKDWNPKGGAALTVADIEGLASRSECNSWYDETNECARAILNITEADVAAGL
ncbi:glycoside hydrolase, partial [Oscillospiraceae bacterium OttesenSCG-928-G22]|nr:glycoside hydrolase [Oscillospiraceae bacterium OttesenSCG-928-G22]